MCGRVCQQLCGECAGFGRRQVVQKRDQDLGGLASFFVQAFQNFAPLLSFLVMALNPSPDRAPQPTVERDDPSSVEQQVESLLLLQSQRFIHDQPQISVMTIPGSQKLAYVSQSVLSSDTGRTIADESA